LGSASGEHTYFHGELAGLLIPNPTVDLAVPTTSVGCSVVRTQTPASPVMLYNAIDWDDNNCYNPANGRYTPTKAGRYRVTANFRWGDAVDTSSWLSVLKNGAVWKWLVPGLAPQNNSYGLNGSVIVPMVIGDYVQVGLQPNSGSRNTSADVTTNWAQFEYI